MRISKKMSKPNFQTETMNTEQLTELPPTAPSDPVSPDPSQPEPLPLPPDSPTPRAPVTEPDPVEPAGDPAPQEPTRIV